jgi:hypothetical protein
MDREITVNEARERLVSARQEKLQKCQAALNALLKEYDCQLSCQLGIVDGRVVGNVLLSANNVE